MRILVVEDEAKVARAVSQGLQAEFYDVAIASTGEDGFFRASNESFDLIILDVMLPGRDGLEILRALRASGSEVPVLVLTARDAVDDRVSGLDQGADDYLVKPFAFPELLARTVTNASVRSDTTAGGLRRFNAALPRDTRILILELGANDGLRGVAASTAQKNLATIIERAQARGISVLLCGMIVPPRYGWSHAVAFHELFPRLAAQYNIPLVPFLLEGVALDPNLNARDRIHPNAAVPSG